MSGLQDSVTAFQTSFFSFLSLVFAIYSGNTMAFLYDVSWPIPYPSIPAWLQWMQSAMGVLSWPCLAKQRCTAPAHHLHHGWLGQESNSICRLSCCKLGMIA